MKTKSVLPWFGSDAGVAKDLAALLDHCKHVTIPFAGGLSILPHLKARAIVANDKHRAALNFYRHLKDPDHRGALITMCSETLSHPGELSDAAMIASREQLTVMDAWAFWAMCWIGRKGKGGTKHQGGKPSVRRTANGGNNASRLRAAAGDLEAWAGELERCEFECDDFKTVLEKVCESAECGVYVDPPWVGVGRNYLHEFTELDHSDLRLFLGRFTEATVVVRYGDDPFIRDLYQERDGWDWIEARSRTQANTIRDEVWIVRNKKQATS